MPDLHNPRLLAKQLGYLLMVLGTNSLKGCPVALKRSPTDIRVTSLLALPRRSRDRQARLRRLPVAARPRADSRQMEPGYLSAARRLHSFKWC